VQFARPPASLTRMTPLAKRISTCRREERRKKKRKRREKKRRRGGLLVGLHQHRERDCYSLSLRRREVIRAIWRKEGEKGKGKKKREEKPFCTFKILCSPLDFGGREEEKEGRKKKEGIKIEALDKCHEANS